VTSLRLAALSFCFASPWHRLQQQRKVWHRERGIKARGMKGNSKMSPTQQEEKETGLFVSWIRTPGREFFNQCFSEKGQLLQMKLCQEKPQVS